MPIGPEQQLSQLQYIQLLQRQAYADAGTQTCPVGASLQVSPGFTMQMSRGQAIRIVSLNSRVFDTGAVTSPALAISSWLVMMYFGTTLVRTIGPSAFGTGPARAGLVLNYTDLELILWNDYIEFGSVGNITCNTMADVNNTDTVARQLSMGTTLLIERYQISTTAGHVGYSP